MIIRNTWEKKKIYPAERLTELINPNLGKFERYFTIKTSSL